MISVATRQSAKERTFAILFNIQGTEYKVFPLPFDAAIGHKAFRLVKQAGDGVIDDLHADSIHGLPCKGFIRQNRCKP